MSKRSRYPGWQEREKDVNHRLDPLRIDEQVQLLKPMLQRMRQEGYSWKNDDWIETIRNESRRHEWLVQQIRLGENELAFFDQHFTLKEADARDMMARIAYIDTSIAEWEIKIEDLDHADRSEAVKHAKRLIHNDPSIATLILEDDGIRAVVQSSLKDLKADAELLNSQFWAIEDRLKTRAAHQIEAMDLPSRLDRRLNEFEELLGAQDSLRKASEEENCNLHQQIAGLQELLADVQGHCRRLEGEKASLTADLHAMTQENCVLQLHLADAERVVDDLEADCNQFDEHYTTLLLTEERHQQRIHELEATGQNLLNQLNDASHRSSDYYSSALRHQEDLFAMTKACNDVREQHKELQLRCSEYSNSAIRFQKQLITMTNARNDTIEELSTLRREYEKRRAELQTSVAQSQEQLVKITTQRKQDLENLRIRHAVKLDQLEAMTKKHDQAIVDLEELRICHDIEFDLQSEQTDIYQRCTTYLHERLLAITSERDNAIEDLNALRRDYENQYAELRSTATASQEQLVTITAERDETLASSGSLRDAHTKYVQDLCNMQTKMQMPIDEARRFRDNLEAYCMAAGDKFRASNSFLSRVVDHAGKEDATILRFSDGALRVCLVACPHTAMFALIDKSNAEREMLYTFLAEDVEAAFIEGLNVVVQFAPSFIAYKHCRRLVMPVTGIGITKWVSTFLFRKYC